MKRNFILAFALSAMALAALNSCTNAAPGPEEEAVWVKKPWIFGHGGIEKDAVSTGLAYGALSSEAKYFKIVPVRYDEKFDDIFSNDNTPLDFNTYINIQIIKGKSPVLLENYGEKWYENNIQVYYRNKTREYVSMYNPFDLISNREVLNRIDSMLIIDMRKHIEELSKNKEFPIMICSVTTGAAKPNKDQLEEMNKTAQYIQQKRSMEQKSVAEQARAAAEKQRAIADKAYMTEMNLSPDQFIQMKLIEKANPNIDVLIGSGSQQMWNVRR